MEYRHAQSAEDVLTAVRSDAANGLSVQEAASRLERDGRNALPQGKTRSLVRLFLSQFHSRLTYILFAAAGISVFFGEKKDAYGILLAVMIDAIFGFVQERRAEDAIEKLRSMVKHEVSVLRGGTVYRIESEELVVGDIVLLDEGDKVPADARLLDARDLQTNESALTGESLTVQKGIEAVAEGTVLSDRTCMVWMGTAVTAGNARAVVVATGLRTAFGGIATSLSSIKDEKSPLEERMDILGQRLGILSIVLAVVVFALGIYQGVGVREMFFFAVAMVVSVIPEGLPAVLALVLAIGVFRMAKKNAIIRHVPSVETLGVTDVICTDKTGTLTENKMTVRGLFVSEGAYRVTGEGWETDGEYFRGDEKIHPIEQPVLSRMLKTMAICNKANLVERDGVKDVIGDPTESALVVAAAKAGLMKQDLSREIPVIDEIPFSSSRKYRAMLVRRNDPGKSGETELFVVGAYDVLSGRFADVATSAREMPFDDAERMRFDGGSAAMAGKALRVLAVAYRPMSADTTSISEADLERLTFLGLVGMMDPPRAEVKDAIAQARAAGVRVMMATGDQQITAVAIAREIGLLEGETDGRVFTGAEVETMDDAAFADALDTAVIFSRVTPTTKLRIVEALEERGHVVAMTGDGVNDAPALKRASIGVAMGIAGTDVTKEVADMVLADDNFVSIVKAMGEGRIIFRNVKQTVAYLFMTNIGEVATILGSMIFGMPLPLLPAQILWMNLVTDGFPDIALATEQEHGRVLEGPPRERRAAVLTKNTLLLTAVTSLVMASGTLGLFLYEYRTGSIEHARTIAFTTMAMFQLWNVFNMRSMRQSLFSLGVFSNMYVFAAVGVSFLLQIAVVYVPFLQNIFRTVPITFEDWLLIVPITGSIFVAVELYKILVRRGVIPETWV